MDIDRHHLRAYIFFLILSIVLVGVLVYLYMPGFSHLRSNLLDVSGEVTMSSEESTIMSGEEEEISTPTESLDTLAARRIHFTNILLRYQSELNVLETSNTGANSNTDEIKQLHIKIESLQSRIAQLAK